MGKHWVTEGRLEASGQFLYSFFFENFLQFYQVIWWKFTYFHLFWYIKGCVKYTVCAWILCCRCRRKDILVFLISFQSLLYLWIFLFDMHTETYVVWWVDLPMTSKLVQQFLERRLPFLSYYLFFSSPCILKLFPRIWKAPIPWKDLPLCMACWCMFIEGMTQKLVKSLQ